MLELLDDLDLEDIELLDDLDLEDMDWDGVDDLIN